MDRCKIEWLTVPAPDLPAAKRFYESAFGFEVSVYSERFWVFKSGTLSGGLDADLAPCEQGIGFSITVSSIEEACDAVVTAGGTIVRKGYSLGENAGYCARFRDPNGNLLELYSDRLGAGA